MTESNNNPIPGRGFLGEVADEIGAALINNPQLEFSMISRTEKVIQKAEDYGQYVRTEWQMAKEAGRTLYDEDKDKEKWFWWTAYSNDFMLGRSVYFANDESMRVQFYIQGKPKPDPLSYLLSMIWGSVGEAHGALELLDYQFVLLAIIHDAQNWQAGRKRIYFNPLEEKTLSDRLCQAVWDHLESKIELYDYRDVKNTIKTALQTIKANLKQVPKNAKDDNTMIHESNKEKSRKLHEIADALEGWRKYDEEVTNAAEWGTPPAKQTIRKAMTLLVSNLALLNECRSEYGCHSPLQQCFMAIEQAASLQKTADLGDFKGWTRDFTKPHLWGGEKRSLADECVRYANEVDREIAQKPRDGGDTYTISAQQVSCGDGAQHAHRDINTITAEPRQGDEESKSDREGIIEAKPPEILGKILWIWRHWRDHWMLVCAGIFVLVVMAIFALPKFHLFGNRSQETHLEAENILDKPIVVANATVEVKIASDWDFDGRVANTKAHLAFVKGDKPMLITSAIGYTASQTGNDEVVYKAKLDMDAKDSAVGNPASFLKDADYIQIEFGRMPSDSSVLGGDAICIINNSVSLKFSIAPQRVVNNRIFIRDLSESLQVLNEPNM